jgi:pimeloyl-ACP methyl ester carboxylesterase
VALEFAARYPDRVRSLVLIHCYATYLRSADYPYGFDLDTTDGLIRDAVSPPSPDQRLDTVLHAAPSAAADDEFRRWWNRVGQRAASPQTAATIRTIATRTDLRHRLPSVSAPSLVLHRRSCLNLDSGHARYLAEHLPEARLVTPGGTDSLWFTDSSEVLDEAIAFLRTGPGPR